MKHVPSHLSTSARRLWARLTADYELDDAAAIALLRALCEAFDRAEQARKRIRRDGAYLKDRFGQLRQHPAVTVERDARAAMIAAIRALKLAPGDAP